MVRITAMRMAVPGALIRATFHTAGSAWGAATMGGNSSMRRSRNGIGSFSTVAASGPPAANRALNGGRLQVRITAVRM